MRGTEGEKEVPYADVNGQRLYYEDTGGFRSVIVFSHGMLLDGTMFAPQVAAFRDGYRCIVWDSRGHGKTAADTEPGYSYNDTANDLFGLLSFLDIDSAILVGASKGAFESFSCALAHPERVRALVLIGAHAGVSDPASVAGYREMIGRWIRGGLPDTLATRLEHIAFGPDWAGAPAWREKWRAMTASNLLSAFDACICQEDLGDKISSIQVPTLVIHGDADAAVPLAKAQAMKEAIPRAEMVVVAGGTRLP
jgi:pimeloyl-ACP methyl ester carboxylesterase